MSTDNDAECTASEGDAGRNAGHHAQRMQARGRFRDPALARKAAQARWAKQRATETPADAGDALPDDDVRTVISSVRVAEIIRALEREAHNGNANAARELRAWLQEYPPTDGSVDTDDLDRRTRDRLLARLLAELEEEDAAESSEALRSIE